MNKVLYLKAKKATLDARDAFDAQRQEWKREKLPQEVGVPFDSRLFWLVCVPVSLVTVLLMVYAVWSWVMVSP